MRADRLKQDFPGLEVLGLLRESSLELFHSLITWESCIVDTRDERSKGRVIVQCTQAQRNFDKLVDLFRSHLWLIVA
jgi:hypothetical protein